MTTPKQKVLFLCTHNSAGSQMAEGLLRGLYGDRYEAFSAGTAVTRVNPYVARAMAEIGIDLSSHRSKHLNEFINDSFDFVVTVCDNAQEACPYFPGGKTMLHHSFPDPSGFTGSDDEIMAGVRLVRGEIRQWIGETFGKAGDGR
ncbi:MAG: arsenate reductase ArsC [Negativicutes bacterium]|nr:arsenate reductase ArsC [Negativicutes bacterium]